MKNEKKSAWVSHHSLHNVVFSNLVSHMYHNVDRRISDSLSSRPFCDFSLLDRHETVAMVIAYAHRKLHFDHMCINSAQQYAVERLRVEFDMILIRLHMSCNQLNL